MSPLNQVHQAVPQRGNAAMSKRARFEREARQTRKRLYNLIYGMVGNRSDAEDLTQEASVRAWSSYARYDPFRPFEAWIARIATNLCIDFYRRGKDKRPISLDTLIVTEEATYRLSDSLASAPHDPARCLLEGELDEKLAESLGRLPENYLSCLLLLAQGCTYEEIGAIMGCLLGSVRSRAHRARRLAKRGLTA